MSNFNLYLLNQCRPPLISRNYSKESPLQHILVAIKSKVVIFYTVLPSIIFTKFIKQIKETLFI